MNLELRLKAGNAGVSAMSLTIEVHFLYYTRIAASI